MRSSRTWSTWDLNKFRSLGTCEFLDSTNRISEVENSFVDANNSVENIRASCMYGQLHESLGLVSTVSGDGIFASIETLGSLLQACGGRKALWEGRQTHAHIISHGIETNVLLGNLLISMYIRCESLSDAYRCFCKMLVRDVFSWTLLITGYAKNGDNEQALELFWSMEQEGVRPNKVTFLSILKSCTYLLNVRIIHASVVQEGCESDDFVVSTLLDVYAKCASIDDAFVLFKKVAKCNVVPWNAMIAGFAQQKLHDRAFTLFSQMQTESVKPDDVTYLNLLKSCINYDCLEDGRKVHASLVENDMDSVHFIANTIVDMYAKCMSMTDAQHTFKNLSNRDIVSWSVMIAGHVQSGRADKALYLFEQMQLSGIKPNKVTYMGALKACASLPSLKKGQHIHLDIVLNQFEHDPFVGSSLVDMYSKCGCIQDARLVFVSIPQQDTVTWNSLIDGYTETGQGEEALKCFWHMINHDVEPDEATFVSSLKACADLADLEQGRQVHNHAVEIRMHSHTQVGNILIEMYAKCGCMTDARQVFDKLLERPTFAWTAAIAGYLHNDLNKEGLQLFDQMKLEGVTPSEFTFSAVSKAYAIPFGLDEGKQLHVPIIQLKLDSSTHIGNSLVDMYAKSGSIDSARQVFDKMPQRDVISYNTIISSCVHNGLYDEAMHVFQQMVAEDVRADKITFICVMKACASLASFEQGMQLHALAIEGALDNDDVLKGILVDMYVKCGCITHARSIFDRIFRQDAVSWTAMVSGYAQHGCGWKAIQLLEQIEQDNAELDEITFIGALSACSYGGLVDEGLSCFHIMHEICGIMPGSQHFACLVDLLGRAGRLDHAVGLLKRIPCQPASVVWTALLGSCKLHGELEMAKFSVECISGLEPGNAVAHVLLSNVKALVCFQERTIV